MDYVTWAGLILVLVILGIVAWSAVVCPWLRERAWRQLAERTGLTCRWRSSFGIPRQGRIRGSYHGRECTLSTFRELGIELRMRVILSIDNRSQGSIRVLCRPRPPGLNGDGSLRELFSLIESDPEGFVREVFASEGLRRRIQELERSRWSRDDYVEVDGHMLRFERRIGRFCDYRVGQHMEHLHGLLDTLCDIAETIEQVSGRASDQDIP